jgi:6-phosphogluconate dehydrogenase
MENKEYDIGMIGLGVMGRNLVLNMSDHDFSVAGYDRDASKVNSLRSESGGAKVKGIEDLADFIQSLRVPRAVMLLIPAGSPVDSVIKEILPHLQPGDMIIDGGNSFYKDTRLREKAVGEQGVSFFGVGISGGESGARHGPSIMPGGPKEAYPRIQPILEAIAAHVDGDACVTYLGPDGAGHYVKMVHNGIEYGLMQLIAETYDFMRRGLRMDDGEIHEVYDKWNQDKLNGFLLKITSDIFQQSDQETGKHLIDEILDEAKQKGTGKWTSQDAMDLQIPVPTIDIAVSMRNLSIWKDQRQSASKLFNGHDRDSKDIQDKRPQLLDKLRNALYAGMLLTYTQGMALLYRASHEYEYQLDLEAVARIWRGGCIIRSSILENIRKAYQASYEAKKELPNLLLDADFGKEVAQRRGDLNDVIRTAADLDIPVPATMTSLAYFDGFRSDWLPANLIQAQRDYFGAHTYERIDEKGSFHTHWETEQDGE